MTKDEYRDAKARLGLTHGEMALLLEVSERQSYRWASGESPVPELVAKVLGLILRPQRIGRERILRRLVKGHGRGI